MRSSTPSARRPAGLDRLSASDAAVSVDAASSSQSTDPASSACGT